MKRFSFLIVLLLLVSVQMPCCAQRGHIIVDSIRSEKLGEWVKYNVYLPAGYRMRNVEKYPVLYLLHGLSDTYTAWDVKGHMRQICDELMASGEADKMVIIMPNAGTPDIVHTWCGYFNVKGYAYEDFFFEELMPAAEKKYCIIGDRRHRAISGLSMGGGGSVAYCMHHPELFAACYAMSAWLDAHVKPLDKTKYMALRVKSVHDNCPMTYLDSVATDKQIAVLKKIDWFVDCGDDDGLLPLSEQLHQSMLRRGLPVQLRVRNGGHTWEYWHQSLRIALPSISRSFGKSGE